VTSWKTHQADYNLRQLQLARRELDAYVQSGHRVADLGRLVASLDALGAALESPDERWLGLFQEQVLALETVYAVRLDRGGELDDDDARIVDEALDELRSLIGSAIDSIEALASGEASAE
jgi:hypothetical protein